MNPPYADYQPDTKKPGSPPELLIRRAGLTDLPAIASLSVKRDGGEAEACLQRLQREFSHAESERSILFIAITGSTIVGFGRIRYCETSSKPVGYPAPEGWYFLGLVVDPGWRRRSIARRLGEHRLDWLRGQTREVYSFTNAHNRASIDLHHQLGFEEYGRAPGYLHVSFDGGEGILFVRKL